MAPAASQSGGKRVAAPPENHQRRPLSQQNVSPPILVPEGFVKIAGSAAENLGEGLGFV